MTNNNYYFISYYWTHGREQDKEILNACIDKHPLLWQIDQNEKHGHTDTSGHPSTYHWNQCFAVIWWTELPYSEYERFNGKIEAW